MVICNLHEFEIWKPGRFPNKPRLAFPLSHLPDKDESLMFLADATVDPVFAEHHRELTKDAAVHVSKPYQSVTDRSAAPIDEIQRFVLQSVWCLYAEDWQMLDGCPLQNIIKSLLADPPGTQRPNSATSFLC